MRLIHGNYEYIGFFYEIEEDEQDRLWATPHKGQHKAANKEKHRRAAAECFNDEYQWDKRIRENRT